MEENSLLWTVEKNSHLLVGVSEYGKSELGGVTYLNLTDIGETLKKGAGFAEVESEKTVVELEMPITGTIVAVNEKLMDNPEKINQLSKPENWLIEIEY